MAASGGTRRGNGAGYGGPATGASKRGPGVGRPRADVAPLLKAAKAERIAAMKDHLLGLALTAEREADQITATLGFLKHEDNPAQRVELGGGLEIVRRIVDPARD